MRDFRPHRPVRPEHPPSAAFPTASPLMIHLSDEGWVWYLSTLGRESEPRVRAADGGRSH